MRGTPEVVLAEVYRHHRQHVNHALRRPGMYGRDETGLRLLMEALAVADGRLADWTAECDGLRSRGAFTATGVAGAFSTVVPAQVRQTAAAAVYAQIAHRLGWLDLDHALTAADYHRLADGVEAWTRQDRTLTEVIDTLGAPSAWIGSSNLLYPKSLCYTTASAGDDLICFHLDGANPQQADPERPGADAEPVLLAVGHRSGNFIDSFSYTPAGRRNRPTEEPVTATPPPIWIFHGERARYASAVFTTREDGLAWAAAHSLNGVLAEYPVGRSYDIAVGEGRFRPTKPHHGTAEHVAGFSPGLHHVHLTDGQPQT